MATRNLFRLVLFVSLLAVVVIGMTFLSCDKRSTVNSPSQSTGPINSLRVVLSPDSLFMSSGTIDTVFIGITALDTANIGVEGVTVRLRVDPADQGQLIQPDTTTDSHGITFGAFGVVPGMHGDYTITATVGAKTQTAVLKVRTIQDNLNRINTMLIQLSPEQVHLTSPQDVDTVQVRVAVLDSSGVGMSGIPVNITRMPAFGFIIQPETTDYRGVALAQYVCQPGIYDTTRIIASAGPRTASRLLNIGGPSVYTLGLAFTPPVPKLIDHEGPPYAITATVVDTTQRGVDGQAVTFSIVNQVGRLQFSSDTITVPRTDPRGIVEAYFYNTINDEINNPSEAIIQVLTTAPDGNGLLSATVTIPLRQIQNTLSLQTSSGEVYGDGTSDVTVRAFLRDTYGHAIIDSTVAFSNPSNDGTIPGLATTDENGMAAAIFTPIGRVDQRTLTQIVAEYKPGTIHQAIAVDTIAILPIRTIGTVTVSLQSQSLTADGEASSAIFITVQDSTGGLIADGTPVYVSHTGAGRLFSPQVFTTDGQAIDTITAPTSIVDVSRYDSIFVRGNISESTFVADTAVVRYDPGLVSDLEFIRPTAPVDLIAGSGQAESLQVRAVDAFGNPVANGTQIQFRKQIASSSLTPISAPTMDGVATTIYLVGSGIGDDNIIAWVLDPAHPPDTIRTLQPVVIHCLSSTATTLVLNTPNADIQVGGSSTQIVATLQDAYGNPLSEGYRVAFQITVSPGATCEEKPSFDTECGVYFDSTTTNVNGQAVVQLYSGIHSGAVSIRACTVSESLYVCDEKSLVTVSSGPPAEIRVIFDASGQAEPPARFCQVGAIVTDRFANPVEYGTAVYFTLTPTEVGEIDGYSITGAPRPPYHANDSTEGTAYTRIVYGCFQTFDTVKVISSSAGEIGQIIDTSVAVQLPIYGGNLACFADPGNMWVPRGDSTARDTSQIMVTLTDDGDCPIKNGRILFTAPIAGYILGQTIDTTDVQGHAYCRFVIRGIDIPCDPLTGRCEVSATVEATLMQKDDVKCSVTIHCTRPFSEPN